MFFFALQGEKEHIKSQNLFWPTTWCTAARILPQVADAGRASKKAKIRVLA
jgi:hypothetical protein